MVKIRHSNQIRAVESAGELNKILKVRDYQVEPKLKDVYAPGGYEDSVKKLKAGETAILLSHGDPIAWFINYKIMGKLPDPKKLRNLNYPNQGEGIVIVLNSKDKIIEYYRLTDSSLLEGKNY